MNGTMLHQTSDSERKVTSDAHYIKVTSKMYNFYLIDMYIRGEVFTMFTQRYFILNRRDL